MRNHFFSVLAACLMVAGGAIAVHAAPLSVGPEGDYQTINAAIANAEPGDVIEVQEGVYEELVLIDKDGITLRGVGDVTIMGDFLSEYRASPSVVINEANGVVLERLYIRTQEAPEYVENDNTLGGDSSPALEVFSSSAEVIDCLVLVWGTAPPDLPPYAGVFVSDSTVRITDSVFAGQLGRHGYHGLPGPQILSTKGGPGLEAYRSCIEANSSSFHGLNGGNGSWNRLSVRGSDGGASISLHDGSRLIAHATGFWSGGGGRPHVGSVIGGWVMGSAGKAGPVFFLRNGSEVLMQSSAAIPGSSWECTEYLGETTAFCKEFGPIPGSIEDREGGSNIVPFDSPCRMMRSSVLVARVGPEHADDANVDGLLDAADLLFGGDDCDLSPLLCGG